MRHILLVHETPSVEVFDVCQIASSVDTYAKFELLIEWRLRNSLEVTKVVTKVSWV